MSLEMSGMKVRACSEPGCKGTFSAKDTHDYCFDHRICPRTKQEGDISLDACDQCSTWTEKDLEEHRVRTLARKRRSVSDTKVKPALSTKPTSSKSLKSTSVTKKKSDKTVCTVASKIVLDSHVNENENDAETVSPDKGGNSVPKQTITDTNTALLDSFQGLVEKLELKIQTQFESFKNEQIASHTKYLSEQLPVLGSKEFGRSPPPHSRIQTAPHNTDIGPVSGHVSGGGGGVQPLHFSSQHLKVKTTGAPELLEAQLLRRGMQVKIKQNPSDYGNTGVSIMMILMNNTIILKIMCFSNLVLP